MGKLKTWQIIVLVLGGLATLCLVCGMIGLIVDSLSTTSTEQAVIKTEVIEPPTLVHTSTYTEIPTTTIAPSTNTPEPSATILPTLTSITTSGEEFTGPASCIPLDNPRQYGIVSRVVDGDTIEVSINNIAYKVRYIGMDTPEMDEEFGAIASAQNSDLVLGKNVVMVKDANETDRYDRLLRFVLVGNTFINHELIKQGYAQAKSYPPDTSCDGMFSLAEQEAKTNNLGIWGIQPVVTVGPTAAGDAPCDCYGPDLDCVDFTTRASAQACYDYCTSLGIKNPHNMDGDGDGLVCESKTP